MNTKIRRAVPKKRAMIVSKMDSLQIYRPLLLIQNGTEEVWMMDKSLHNRTNGWRGSTTLLMTAIKNYAKQQALYL